MKNKTLIASIAILCLYTTTILEWLPKKINADIPKLIWYLVNN